jgi:hypothetical protein
MTRQLRCPDIWGKLLQERQNSRQAEKSNMEVEKTSKREKNIFEES